MIQILKKCWTFQPARNIRNISSSTDGAIKRTTIGKVTCIGLNRVVHKNYLNVEMLTQLQSALNAFENDTSSLAAVLYGEKGNFSSGFDPNEVDDILEIQKLIQQITEHFSKKPLIAAVSGFAVGPAFDLALWCDFRVVEETAVMAAFAKTFGVPINDSAAKRLCSLIGTHRTLDWVLTGRVVKAKEALDCGIATRIVACGTGLGQAVNFANSLCNMPQACLTADRATILSTSDKFPSHVQRLIIEEKMKYLKLAIAEVKQGLHLTESGDVRRKDI